MGDRDGDMGEGMKPRYKLKGRQLSAEGDEIYVWEDLNNETDEDAFAMVDWFWRDPSKEFVPPTRMTEPVPVSDVLVQLYALADPCTPNAECGHEKCVALEEIRQNLGGIDYAMARVREWLEPIVNWCTQANQHGRDITPRVNEIANYARAAMEPSTGIYRPVGEEIPEGVPFEQTPEPTRPSNASEVLVGPSGQTLWLRDLTQEVNGSGW